VDVFQTPSSRKIANLKSGVAILGIALEGPKNIMQKLFIQKEI
jgi:hypothetical protein